ncbi:helix-turn-helix domain-containing protein [uncultured Algibacter sp.]|uniref:helix-turn-helix domain-containing protein n=1 Tax=uncultured Algibacter sp. TaxID=298659 RepID=UPI00261E6C6A|nr:helix-turn-helix domain-containing protein [uncultured Algibacter sp.]
MNNLKFEDLPKAMETVLEKLSSVEKELKNIKENFQPKEQEELMTRQEVADYLKINITTLWNWTKKGKLNSYGIGYRVYYKRSEIENTLIKINKI